MELLDNKKYGIPIVVLFVFFMFYKPVVCFIILGSLVSIISIYFWNFLSNIQKNGIKNVGKILFYESDSEGHKTPTVEFTTNNGIQIRKKPYYYASTDLSKIRNYKNNIDKKIDILYDPQNPEKFVIGKERNFNRFSLIFGILVGIIFLTVGICSVLGIINVEF
jgi:hypothetical protein